MCRKNRCDCQSVCRIYDTWDIHITPFYSDPWISIDCRKLKLAWKIHNNSDSKARFSTIAYDRLELVVHIYAPDPDDRPDFETVFVPFLWLADVKELKLIPDSPKFDMVADWGLINYGCEFILNGGWIGYHDSPCSRDPQYRDLVR
ncbi:hypothetical protein BO71DRAFT_413338 [Aspergillus ellipticus CBS 707.79]|uniref:Uncharacterized protein n=1 Tax=Aspergillus ellipticus CBS 707.79 TaxID=1448320 RepID=A0A319D4K9_9EURO|nr:hypothetical protein BO71DRAFT_413338 [Aspergillus ellipticus CBS 707.79]